MPKHTAKKSAAKKVPAGYHRMPDGSVMKNSAHKGRKPMKKAAQKNSVNSRGTAKAPAKRSRTRRNNMDY